MQIASDVEFAGERFGIADKIGLMPLMRFAKAAQGGVDSNDMAGLAAIYDLLEQCIAPADWQRFQDTADKARAGGEELMAVVKEVMERMAARPTARPSDSSAGPQSTPPSSEDGSSSQVIARLEQRGRPELALMVRMADEGRSKASA